jgi:hypothetical protein
MMIVLCQWVFSEQIEKLVKLFLCTQSVNEGLKTPPVAKVIQHW